MLCAINTVAFDAKANRLVSAAGDGTARLWNIDTQETIAVLRFQMHAMFGAALMPDGTRLATLNRTAQLWHTFPTTRGLVEYAKRTVPRCLTPAEYKAAFLETSPATHGPPDWCITGPGLVHEANSGKWKPKYPYNTPSWRDWLAAKRRGENPAFPGGG